MNAEAKGGVLTASVVGHKARRRAVLLWMAAAVLMIAPLPMLPRLRGALQSRLLAAGAHDVSVGVELGTSIWLFVAMLGVCAYVAGNQTRKPMVAQARILAFLVSMLLLAAGYLVFNMVRYLQALHEV